jgi:hypothetical protein
MPEAATVNSRKAFAEASAKLKSGARYQLEKPFYADDNYIDEGEIIEFDGMPNEAMKPLNEEARHNQAVFFELNGGRTPPLADMMEKAMRERPKEPMVTRLGSNPIVPLTGTVAAEGLPKPRLKEPTVKHIPKSDESRIARQVRMQGANIDEIPGKGSI